MVIILGRKVLQIKYGSPGHASATRGNFNAHLVKNDGTCSSEFFKRDPGCELIPLILKMKT